MADIVKKPVEITETILRDAHHRNPYDNRADAPDR